MLDNWEIALRGPKTLLVPYHERYVKLYHSWMEDPWLRETTCSEQLSLEEEFTMQKEWKIDSSKCTFIVAVAAAEGETGAFSAEEGRLSHKPVGDINLFLSQDGAEISVMIADAAYSSVGQTQHLRICSTRRCGLAKEAVVQMMKYGAEHIGIERFFCKIGDQNAASIALFQAIGFTQCGYAEAFKEVELERVWKKGREMDEVGAIEQLPWPA
ncbi:unnamed protein product [Chrysoparadoxa australica]